MSVSAVFSSRMAVAPPSLSFPSSSVFGGVSTQLAPPRLGGSVGGLLIVCSSRPKKKGTAHHRKTRPRKTQAWDIKRRGPTVYPPLPPLPPEWSFATEEDAVAEAASPPPQETPDTE